MGASYYRYQNAYETAVRELLLRWLDSIPEVQWKGTICDVKAELELMNNDPVPVRVASGSGLSKTLAAHEPSIAAAGWRLEFTRTKAARFVVLTPVRRKPAPTDSET